MSYRMTLTTSAEIERPHAVDRIDAALSSLVSRAGVTGVSFRSVAKESGMSLSTVAYYFPSRTALLEHALQSHFRRAVGVARRPYEGLREMARALARFGMANRAGTRLTILSWVDRWRHSDVRKAHAEALLRAMVAPDWDERWTERDRLVVAQLLTFAVRDAAALADEDLLTLTGDATRERASERIVDVVGRMAESFASGPGATRSSSKPVARSPSPSAAALGPSAKSKRM